MEALYLTRPTNHHQSLLISDESKVHATMSGINLRSVASEWQRLPFHFQALNKHDDRRPTICPVYFSGALAVRSDFKEELFPQCIGIEFLPLDVSGEEWLLINCLNEVRSFDESASTVMRDADPRGQIFMVSKLVVTDPAAKEFDVFTLAGSNHADLFVRPPFKERVERLGLEGLTFAPIGHVAS